MRRRGSTGDLERSGKRRKVMSADDILHAFVESRLKTGFSAFVEHQLINADQKKQTEFSKQAELGRKLSVLATLPRSDLKNTRFVDLVNRISISGESIHHDNDDDDEHYAIIRLKIHPYPHLIVVEKSDERFAVSIHQDIPTISYAEIFATVGSATVRCDAAKWAELEVALLCGSSFLLRCLNSLQDPYCDQLEYDQPDDGYLCYPFFREFRSHLTRSLRECLESVLIPELVNILVDYSSPPFEHQNPNELMWFKQKNQIHQYFVPRTRKLKISN